MYTNGMPEVNFNKTVYGFTSAEFGWLHNNILFINNIFLNHLDLSVKIENYWYLNNFFIELSKSKSKLVFR